MFRVKSWLDVLIYASLISLVAMSCTGGFVHLVTYSLLPPPEYAFAMLLAVGLPLIIAFPISILALRIVKIITDAVERIETFVKFDALTGVLARSYFIETARQRFAEGGALLLIDADHFKRINDTHGHDVGDEALKVIGSTLSRTVPLEGLVGRIGGEEFAVFLPGVAHTEAHRVAAAICAEMRRSGKVVAGKPLEMTLSIGLALVEPGSTVAIILKRADDGLYLAKAEGRDRVVQIHP